MIVSFLYKNQGAADQPLLLLRDQKRIFHDSIGIRYWVTS